MKWLRYKVRWRKKDKGKGMCVGGRHKEKDSGTHKVVA